MQVVVHDLMTSYYRAGKGKQLLLLPGWADTSASWQKVADGLAKQYDVIVLDLPGFGGTQAPSEAWGLNEYGAFVASFIKKLQLKPYVLAGHSNGGGIAIRGIANGNLAAKKLVLLASAGVRNQEDSRKKALKVVAKTGKLLSKPLPSRVQRNLRRKLYERAGSDMLVAPHMQATFQKIVTDDVQNDARQLRIPTLLIYGDVDVATPVHHAQLLHRNIKDSTLEILPDVGHFLQLDSPTKVVQLIEDFIVS